MELEFNRCPEIDKDLEDWSTLFPSIRRILSEDPATFNGGEWACFEWKASGLAELHEDVLSEDKKSSQIEYIFPEATILKALDGYAGSSWIPDVPAKLKEKREKKITQKIKEVREYEEKERAYVNNIVRDWKNYDVPQADQGDYAIRETGIFKTVVSINPETNQPQYVTKEVCRTPFVLCGVSDSFSDEEVGFKIRYPIYTGDVREFWASQSELLSRKELKTLFLSKGINCPENALLMETMEYISRSIAEFSRRYKKQFSTKQCGWNESNSVFVIGNRCVTKKGVEPVITVGAGKGYPELDKVGTLEGWAEGVKEMMEHDVVRFKSYDIMTAILNRPIGLESHITDHYGNTSVGKTFSAWMGLSMVGNAEGLTIGAKSSYKGILVTVRDFSDLPLLIDESSDAGEHLADLVYPLTSNKGRVTSTANKERDGGEEYHTTTLFTGERPVRDCLNNSGQQYRVNELDDTMPDLETRTINRVTNAIRKNHGHVIELYVQEVLKMIEQDTLQGLYDECFDLLPKNNSNIEGRSRSIFAGIMTAGRILEPIFEKAGIKSKDPIEIVNKYFKKCILDKPVELEYIRALRVILDWINSDYGSFVRNKAGYDDAHIIDKNTTFGFVNDDYIDLIESEFTKKMKSASFAPSKIKEDLYKQGVTVANDVKRQIYRTSIKKYGPYAAIRINRAIAGELVGYNLTEPEDETEEVPEFSQFEKINLITDSISLLTRARGKAEIQYLRKILPIPELDDLLNILSKNGKVLKISQTEYKPI